MTMPRFALEDDDDSTAPAQFLLTLPPWYARKLEALSSPTPNEWMLAPPVIAPRPVPVKAPRASRRLIATIAGVAVAVSIIAGVGGALAQSSEGPVGISKRAPKKLEHAMRVSTWQSGVARVQAPAVADSRHSRKHGKR
jgi:hypothetical protein